MKTSLLSFLLLLSFVMSSCGGGGSSQSSQTSNPSLPPAPGAISSTFFGVSIADPTAPPPASVPVGAVGHPPVLAWATIEPSHGVYDFSFYDAEVSDASRHNVPFTLTFGWTPSWALANQSSCVVNICSAPPDNLQDWTDFVTTVVNHYNGITAPHIQFYELWNEAQDASFWSGTPAQLVTLAQAAYPVIHQDAQAIVLTPSVTGPLSVATAWVQSYLQAGGNKYADAVSFHGYLSPTGTTPYPFPEDSSSYGDIVTRVMMFRSVYDTNGLAGKPLYDTEGSWGFNNITGSTQQAAWLARWYVLQAGAGVAAAYWFTWGNSNAQGQQWGLISNPNDTPTAAGVAFGEVSNWLTGANISACARAADDTWTCALTRPGGYQAQIVWNHSVTTSFQPASQFKQYRDLAGNTTSISGPIAIGAEPIILESGTAP